ncbi:MAG TPA: ABC transporter ATP-binding protein [Polyangiaceae bacterium]|jgi:ABC-2 type transport system ATP-binding protein|nr:ABC transporter ATP-binding protein [Polyangiaceae bacterium]
MIDVTNLVKDYGTVVAVNGVSFHVGRGEVVGFLGPNGAGKSTTLRILAGFLGPTSGKVRVDGRDVVDDGIAARRSIGYMPEAAPLYPEMRVREYLRFRAELKGVPRKKRVAAIGDAMESARVTEMHSTLIGHLSKGYRQRVGLADALVANPPLLILDEPTAGLDPNQIREVRDLIKRLGENHTILLSTHILPEVETTCARAIVIDRGKLVAEGTIDELRAGRRGAGATLLVSDWNGRAAEAVKAVAGVESVGVTHLASPLVHLAVRYAKSRGNEGSDPALLEQVVATLVGAGYGVREATPARATLEDVFAELTLAEGEGHA